jgi:hypothetical protein
MAYDIDSRAWVAPVAALALTVATIGAALVFAFW